MALPIPPALVFLRKSQEYMEKNFDSSDRLPDNIRSEYTSVDAASEWLTYLKYKFAYLYRLETSENENDEKFIAALHSGGKDYLAEFLPEWKKRAENERMTYYYRISQLPRDVVHDRWYYQQIDEIHKWCKLQQEKLQSLDSEVTKSPWQDRLAEVYKRIGSTPFSNFHDERFLALVSKLAIQGITKRIYDLQSSLSKTSVSFDDISGQLAAECQQVLKDIQRSGGDLSPIQPCDLDPFERNFLVDLSLTLIKSLYAEGFNDTALFARFLSEIKTKFNCEVCDFLEVTEGNKKLVWRVATVNHVDLSPEYQELQPEVLRLKVQEHESYGEGIGITGSMLLLDYEMGRNIWTHIGSNDVLHDPRQSEEHRSAYESDMYPGVLKADPDGKIKNFWAFPIFSANKLIGAFRVVNKLGNDGTLQPGGWPYLTRVQLSLVADWFSRFLETAFPQLQSKEDYIEVLERNRQVDEMTRKIGLDWIDKGALQAFLRHLRRDISKKQEKRHVGCCIVIARKISGRRLIEELPSYPLIDILPEAIRYPYDKLDAYHDAVDPLQGAYIFDENGSFVRIAKLEWNIRDSITLSGYRAIERITQQHNQSFCLLLDPNAKSILGYNNGKRAVEIHISEGTGNWGFRYPLDLLDKMTQAAPDFDPEAIEIVCEACLEMSSRGCGGLYILGNVPEESFSFSQPKIQYKNNLENVRDLGKSLLVEFAKLDGATFITKEGYITRVNTTVRAVEPPQRTLFRGKGARHEAGETISKRAPEALVIIVSENRGISMVADGEIIAENL